MHTFKASLARLIVVGGVGFLVGIIESPHSNAAPVEMKGDQGVGQVVAHREILEGEFWGIKIGFSKGEVIDRLQALHVEAVMPQENEKIIVTQPEDLEKLATAEGIIWFPGDVRIRFVEDAVVDRQILLSNENWAIPLRKATTRSEVFAILRDALASDKGIKIGNYSPDIRWILVAKITQGDRALLEKYDAWTLNHGDPLTKFWHVRLRFSDGRLLKIETISSSTEFP